MPFARFGEKDEYEKVIIDAAKEAMKKGIDLADLRKLLE